MPVQTTYPAHARLLESMIQLGHPIIGASGTGPGDVRLSFAAGASPVQAAAALAYAQATFDWSQTAHDAWLNLRRRVRAQADLTEPTEQGKLLRAVLLTLLDSLNQLRQNPTTVFPVITPAQARAVVLAKLDSGDAD